MLEDETKQPFAGEGWEARHVRPEDQPALQALFAANDAFAIEQFGQPWGADQARIALRDLPPSHVAQGPTHFLGVWRPEGLSAYLSCTDDFLARGVLQLSFFLVDERLRGTGFAQAVLDGLLGWAKQRGASFLRLGVSVDNPRASAFWRHQGLEVVGRCQDRPCGQRQASLHIMMRPLSGGSLEAYLALMPLDRRRAEGSSTGQDGPMSVPGALSAPQGRPR